MNNYNEEREINLVDMFWSICLKWRSIVLWGLIFALILGGFGYYKSTQHIDLETIKFEKDEEDAIDAYLAYKELYDIQAAYNKYSPLMQLNANKFYANVITYYVDNYYQVEYPIVDSSNNINALVQAYKTSLKTDTFKASIADALELHKKAIPYATEMVDMYNSYSDVATSTGSANIITITIYGATEAECETLTTLVKDHIVAQADAMTTQFGKHNITIISEGIQSATSISLSTYQKQNVDYLTSYKTSLETQKSSLSDKALEYVDATAEIDEDEEEVANSDNTLSSVIKFTIIGLILGLFVVAFVLAMRYILSTKLRVADGFERMFRTNIIGIVPSTSTEKKRILRFVDNIFIKQINKNKPKRTRDEALNMIITNLKLQAKQHNIKDIYVTGTTIDTLSEDIIDYMTKKLGNSEVTLTTGRSLITDVATLENLYDKGNVVIIEKAGQATYNDIYTELNACKIHNVKVLGAVIVE